MKKQLFFLFLLAGAISMIVMSSHYLNSDISGILRRKEIALQWWYQLIFKSHVLFGLISITIGPFQFIKSLRKNHPITHRYIGYLYVFSIMTSGFAGLVVAPFAMGGLISSLGFSLLAMVWLLTTLKAILAVRSGNLMKHQKWMFISYGFTFSSITQRTMLLIPLFTSVPFIPIYQLSAWLPSVINSAIAYKLYKNSLNTSLM